MNLPLTLAICLLGAIACGSTYLMIRQAQRSAYESQQIVQAQREIYAEALKAATDTARNQAKYADKMVETLSQSVREVTEGLSQGMSAVYGPPQKQMEAALQEDGDIATPWYSREGALDLTDPTDGLIVADPVEYPEGGSNLIMDDDDEPFGIPGLKVGE